MGLPPQACPAFHVLESSGVRKPKQRLTAGRQTVVHERGVLVSIIKFLLISIMVLLIS